jgi:hypothetical protein
MEFNVGDKVRTKTRDRYDDIVGVIISRSGNTYWVDLGYSKHIFDYFELELENRNQETYVQNCPRCNGELKDKVSEYTGTVVKKCKCGWCD